MSALAVQDAALARILALAVTGRWPGLKRAIREAAKQGLPRAAIQEILLQSHLFAGFPRCLEAFEVFAAVESLGELAQNESAALEGAWSEARRARGRELFERIYASKSQEVLARIGRFHPDLRSWIEEHAYARVLARPGLSAKQRELASIAALVATRQWRQLLSHWRGALRCGASENEVLELLEALRGIVPTATISKAKRFHKTA